MGRRHNTILLSFLLPRFYWTDDERHDRNGRKETTDDLTAGSKVTLCFKWKGRVCVLNIRDVCTSLMACISLCAAQAFLYNNIIIFTDAGVAY